VSAEPSATEIGQGAADFERRFGGLRRLYGPGGAQRIFDAHVIVVGIGGVGSWAAEALARSGVGRITLIDLDHIAESNTNRQIHALEGSYGQAKVEAMRARIAAIHPGCHVLAIDDFVTPDNWPSLLAHARAQQGMQGSLAVIDACDQMAAKVTLAAWSRDEHVRFVTVGAAGGKRRGEQVEIADIACATHDPLLAQLRQRLRKAHGAPRQGAIGVTAVFSREAVRPPDAACMTAGMPDGSLNCHGYGSSVAVTATFGLCAAGWVMDAIASDA
jgi:tRNA A37 threonylcarbamoyladenosine dehydratase